MLSALSSQQSHAGVPVHALLPSLAAASAAGQHNATYQAHHLTELQNPSHIAAAIARLRWDDMPAT